MKTSKITGPCAYCGGPTQGNYAIHRDDFGLGPEVPLCDEHGGKPEPTREEIWDRIRERVVPTRRQKRTWRRRVSRACHTRHLRRMALILSAENEGALAPTQERQIAVNPFGECGPDRIIEAPWLRRRSA